MDTSEGVEVYSMGLQSLRISRHALHNTLRMRLVAEMRNMVPAGQDFTGVALLAGGGPNVVDATDMDAIFRQESYFQYLFGCAIEDAFGALDLRDGRSILFVPCQPQEHAVWMGAIPGLDEIKAQHAVDECHYCDSMAEVLAGLKPPCLHVLCGVNSNSGRAVRPADFPGMAANFQIERTLLLRALQECRVVKSEEELEIMRYANKLASRAHVQVMQSTGPGMMEYQAESLFLHSVYSDGGCRHAPYTPICASGPNGAVLHYGHAGHPNNRQVADGDLLLFDMGCEYYGYDSDITCTFPASGSFTKDQVIVYEAVLAAHQAVVEAMQPGVAWPEMHLLAERHILAGLKAGGFVQGSLEEMMAVRLCALFMPHGLGHLLGLDTHDVGGYTDLTPPRIDKPGLRSLRTARTLKENMVMTVEPGCYFNRHLLEPAFKDSRQAAFLNKDRISRLWGFGGVRLEDDVIVTATGAESMTDVPRTVEDVEAVMKGGAWPPSGRRATNGRRQQAE